jgi:hypothetical protein
MISMLPLSKIDCEFETLSLSRVKSLGNIILIPNQPVFTFSPQCCVLSGESPNTNFMVWFDPTQAQTHNLPYSRRLPYYTTDVVLTQGSSKVMYLLTR